MNIMRILIKLFPKWLVIWQITWQCWKIFLYVSRLSEKKTKSISVIIEKIRQQFVIEKYAVNGIELEL